MNSRLSGYLGTLLAVWVLCCSSFAHADLKVKWDCFLPDSSMTNLVVQSASVPGQAASTSVSTPATSGLDCQALARSYFSTLSFLTEVNDENQADVLLRVRETQIQGGTQYSFDFIGARDLPKFSILDRIPVELTSDNVVVRLVTDLTRGTVPFSSLSGPPVQLDGQNVISVGDPSQAGGQPPVSQNDTGWYVTPSLILNYAKSSLTSININGTVGVNWSDPTWRVQAGVGVSYSKIDVSIPGMPDVTGEVFNYGANSVVSYTLTGGWSVAALVSGGHTPQQNEDITLDAGVGLEWTLVPFMKTNEQNIQIRYAIGPNYMKFSSPNFLNEDQATFFRHMVQIYLSWHFDRVDLGLTGSVSSNVDNFDYLTLTATGNATFRITDQFEVTASVTGSYQNQFINQPLNSDGTNAVDAILGDDDYSQVSFSGMLTLTYVFGNSLLNTEDQRWKNVSF